MKSGFNYGLLFTAGGVLSLFAGVQILGWFSRRAEQRPSPDDADVKERLQKAEAALERAREELASVRAMVQEGR